LVLLRVFGRKITKYAINPLIHRETVLKKSHGGVFREVRGLKGQTGGKRETTGKEKEVKLSGMNGDRTVLKSGSLVGKKHKNQG